MGTPCGYDDDMNDETTPIYTSTCERCGVVFERESGRNRRLCQQCATDTVLCAADQMHNKTGPLYEKSVRKQLTYWKAEAKRLGIR